MEGDSTFYFLFYFYLERDSLERDIFIIFLVCFKLRLFNKIPKCFNTNKGGFKACIGGLKPREANEYKSNLLNKEANE